MVMEHVSGESLERLLEREGKLDIVTAVSLMKNICQGLAAAHSCMPPVIHRDIKASNIIIAYDDPDDPHAKVADFGLAAAVDNRTHLGYSAGALICMPPEAFFDIATTASDIFSAGILFYEMLTGRHPWQYEFNKKDENSDDRSAIIAKARLHAPPRADEISKACPKAVADIVEKMLEPDRKERYQNGMEVLEAFNSISSFRHANCINVR
jgi:serine/threonine-protein kinase